MAQQDLKSRRRSDYPFQQTYSTRWADDDMYQHMNNSAYYFLYDSIVNWYLIGRCGFDPRRSSQIGLVVNSNSNFFGSVGFPDVLELGLRVARLGTSSVVYEIGVFQKGVDDVRAVGTLTHVFVDKGSKKPASAGIEDGLRRGLEALVQEEKARL